ncbi:MAG: hypothetical protein SNH18_07370 [Rikenellaceae bacterium]
MNKSTTIPTEILNIFSEQRHSSIFAAFCRLLESLILDRQTFGGNKRVRGNESK